MHTKGHPRNSLFGMSWSPTSGALAIMLALLFLIFLILFITLTAQPVRAQTFQVIYTFTSGDDGGEPRAGITIDDVGNLYGTTEGGGTHYKGVVYQMTFENSSWTFTPLFEFPSWANGLPYAGVARDANGALYGATECCVLNPNTQWGNVFKLEPSSTGLWNETILHWFSDGADGGDPYNTPIVDPASNVYGTTMFGGATRLCDYAPYDFGCGTVYKLSQSNGGWTESVLHDFTGGDGKFPMSALLLDSAGNLYGTTAYGGAHNCGTAFELTPSGAVWTETVLHDFNFDNGDGCNPNSPLVFGPDGNLYGGTSGGSVFQLSRSSGQWTFAVLHTFPSGEGPVGNLAVDRAGSIYGATGGFEWGNVFRVSPSNGTWTYTSLHDFTGSSDGASPFGGVSIDANGNLYGTTFGGGSGQGFNGWGVVYEITP
ncbi:MAG: choice-of-anchor tandem repeat GloVer-containing protein [Candidatus Korobacteraceae bacterium]|jgi:uncharacterized repeat protein (TIGR03803 family)